MSLDFVHRFDTENVHSIAPIFVNGTDKIIYIYVTVVDNNMILCKKHEEKTKKSV